LLVPRAPEPAGGLPAIPSAKLQLVSVACPKCGHTQAEPQTAYSTICKQCREHFRVQEALHPEPKAAEKVIERKSIQCLQCGAELEVPVAATSSMCKKCGSYIDLSDYHIRQTVSRNFRTCGRFVLEEKGYVLNADVLAGDAVIKGRFIGKLVAQRTLEIHSSANIKGSLTGGCLVVPAKHHFRWPEWLRCGGADIAGELVGDVRAPGTVWLRATGRFFGNVEAGNLVVESGAVFVGAARVGQVAGR
jgi:cytoskeletal protein CcmA (bactofilin family)